MYFYHAHAIALGGRLGGPVAQSIPSQGACSLEITGGHQSATCGEFQLPGVISFSAACTEVQGKKDNLMDSFATYASSVLEDLNIWNIVTADRVVSSLTVHQPDKKDLNEATFSISGSHFENLRIAGHKIDISFNTGRVFQANGLLNDMGAYRKELTRYRAEFELAEGSESPTEDWGMEDYGILNEEHMPDRWLGEALQEICSVADLSPNFHDRCWRAMKRGLATNGVLIEEDDHSKYLNLANTLRLGAGIRIADYRFRCDIEEGIGVGPTISIPGFGIIRLGELVLRDDRAKLNMIRVTMSSEPTGNLVAANTETGWSGVARSP